jgi:hypothetical protein
LIGETDLGNPQQRTHTWPAAVRETRQPAFHKDPILFRDRHEIGHGAQRHEIEIIAQIGALLRGQPFQQCVRDFKNDPDAAQVVMRLAQLRIHQGDTGGTASFKV